MQISAKYRQILIRSHPPLGFHASFFRPPYIRGAIKIILQQQQTTNNKQQTTRRELHATTKKKTTTIRNFCGFQCRLRGGRSAHAFLDVICGSPL
jgi:hypothetical protein